MQSPRRKPKLPEYGTEREESNRHESDSEKNEDGPSETKSVSAKEDSKSAIVQSC